MMDVSSKIPQCTGNLLCNGKQKNCRLAQSDKSYLLVSARSSNVVSLLSSLVLYSLKKSYLIDLDRFSTWKTREKINFLELLEVFIIAHKSEESRR